MRKRQVETGVAPFVSPYRQVLDQLRRRGRSSPLVRRVSELTALLELTEALGQGLAGVESLDAALAIVAQELQVGRGAFFVRSEEGTLVLRASRGLPPGAPSTLGLAAPRSFMALGPGDEAHDRQGLVLLVPIHRHDREVAVLGLGPREGDRSYGAEEQAFLQSVATSVAAPIENSLLYDELRGVHRKLSVKRFELHNLFDISRDLTGTSAEEVVQNLIMTAVMGHFVVSRCAIYLDGPRGLSLAHSRGLRRDADSAPPIPLEEADRGFESLTRPRAVDELPNGPLRLRLEQARLVLAVPLATGARVEGVLGIGARASGMPFSEEDREIAEALARQAQVALENARLQQVREEKLRQDRELQIARNIQRSLFPSHAPDIPGFEVAAESHPCYEVGGDSYDWIPLGGQRLALVIADVAGKGTPASLLMASVHAFVHARAGTAALPRTIELLNRFLVARTQENRFVTLFYAELDAASRRLAYVNAGHVPPYRLSRDGTVRRLAEGGPALGLLEEGSYEVGEVQLEAGDVVALVTDGVTEAMTPGDEEFGDDRVCETLRRLSRGSASFVLEGLVASVNEWAGGSGFGDDLTALILKVL